MANRQGASPEVLTRSRQATAAAERAKKARAAISPASPDQPRCEPDRRVPDPEGKPPAAPPEQASGRLTLLDASLILDIRPEPAEWGHVLEHEALGQAPIEVGGSRELTRGASGAPR